MVAAGQRLYRCVGQTKFEKRGLASCTFAGHILLEMQRLDHRAPVLAEPASVRLRELPREAVDFGQDVRSGDDNVEASDDEAQQPDIGAVVAARALESRDKAALEAIDRQHQKQVRIQNKAGLTMLIEKSIRRPNHGLGSSSIAQHHPRHRSGRSCTPVQRCPE